MLGRALDGVDLDSVYKIGIAWQGNPQNRIDRWRSFPLELLEPLAGIPGVRLISLQKGAGTEQLSALGGRFPVAQLDAPIDGIEPRRNFLDTAAIMALMDLVITPETATAHLAGALAVNTWVALCHAGDWRWMDSGDSCPWYCRMRLFRQHKMGVWDNVFHEMARALEGEVSRRARP